MKLFLSYAHEQSAIADTIAARLSASGHEVFFDKNRTIPGLPFDEKIFAAVKQSEIFVFLISPESLKEDKYALLELRCRREKFENPAGTMLPVAIAPLDADSRVDPYLTSVTILTPKGDIAAEVVYAVWKLYHWVPAQVVPALAPAVSTEAVTVYKRLWELTNVLPRWPRRTDASYSDLGDFSEGLRDWYFVGAGGMFLSRTAHSAYWQLQEALTAMISQGITGRLAEDHYDHIRELCSQLRSQRAAHIGSRT